MEPITKITSRLVPLPNENVDTDIIVPARFLKVTDKAGMDQYLFRDWRFDEAGKPLPDFILNQPRAKGAQILLAGRNFGSGSSREHAPWALLAFGFRALLSTSFADIFQGNALKNGLLPVVIPPDVHADLFRQVEKNPNLEVTVELASQTVTLPDGKTVSFPIDNFSKQCLLAGVDQLGYLLKQESHIRAYEQSHPPRVQTTIGS
ncbi:MAG: 3-isopropylmalate dehydratase small subunit [Acidobacteria bacterium]|nr:3-isopropylmalate dehydratase small subunit [Acidobacteriota bacterium]MCZ6750283.1 3-isopropylmalate dehydratase small subunit [Acidobacteriota bacterium]